MPSKTVSLEASAYDRLKAAKAPDESFSEAINRILADSKPSYRALAGFLSPSEAKRVKGTIRRMRADEIPVEQTRILGWKESHGRRSRH
jgi:predicted CopG family antitoxin